MLWKDRCFRYTNIESGHDDSFDEGECNRVSQTGLACLVVVSRRVVVFFVEEEKAMPTSSALIKFIMNESLFVAFA